MKIGISLAINSMMGAFRKLFCTSDSKQFVTLDNKLFTVRK